MASQDAFQPSHGDTLSRQGVPAAGNEESTDATKPSTTLARVGLTPTQEAERLATMAAAVKKLLEVNTLTGHACLFSPSLTLVLDCVDDTTSATSPCVVHRRKPESRGAAADTRTLRESAALPD